MEVELKITTAERKRLQTWYSQMFSRVVGYENTLEGTIACASQTLGRPLQAMIAVRLASGARGHLSGFAEKMAALPEVLNVFFLGGADDFLVHIATEGSQSLRDFVVVHLSSDPDVALTETNLIFDHLRADLTH